MADKQRIEAIRAAGKDAKAPKAMIDYMVGRGCALEEAQAAFADLNANGQWSNGKNSATFHAHKAKE